MKAENWIDRVKQTRGWESDYRVAKELDLSRATISAYRKRTPTLDEDSALKVAKALGERPEAIILDQLAERTKDQSARAALSAMASSLCILCKVNSLVTAIKKHSKLSPSGGDIAHFFYSGIPQHA